MSQKIHISEKESLHAYRTEIPNIIFELGLDPFELRLYLEIKRIAGDKGSSYASIPCLSKRTGISDRKLRYIKKSLCLPRDLLGGKALLREELQKRDDGGNGTLLIWIQDIWEENFTFLMSKKEDRKIKEAAPHAVPPAQCAVPPLQDMQDPPAPRAYKEDPIKEDPVKKKENTYVASPSAHDVCTFFIFQIKSKKPNFTKEVSSSWLKDFDKLLALRSPDQIKNIIEHVVKSDFWFKNILSPEKLHKHLDSLEIEMSTPLPSSASPPPVDSEDTKKNKALWEEALERFPDQCKEINVFRGSLTSKDGRDVSFSEPHERFTEVIKKMLGLKRRSS